MTALKYIKNLRELRVTASAADRVDNQVKSLPKSTETNYLLLLQHQHALIPLTSCSIFA